MYNLLTHLNNIGLLPPSWAVGRATTLRVFLAERLNCDAMRITKKFIG